jgi:hypothetical protein
MKIETWLSNSSVNRMARLKHDEGWFVSFEVLTAAVICRDISACSMLKESWPCAEGEMFLRNVGLLVPNYAPHISDDRTLECNFVFALFVCQCVI